MDWNGISWNGRDFYRTLKRSLRGAAVKVRTSLPDYLDREPSVQVFEVERSLVSAECQSVVCMQALHLLITVHNEDLRKRKRRSRTFTSFTRLSVAACLSFQ